MAIKITYSTMSGEQMEDLHRALDEAIAKAPSGFGREYPFYAGGQPVRSSEQFDDRSPIDTGILIGRFQQGTRD